MSRKTAREIAMKRLYAQCVHGGGEYDELLELSGIEETASEADKDYAESLCSGVEEKLEQLDGLIGGCLVDWTIDRLALVDLCIMRIATYEMQCVPDVTVGIAINEAVEEAKRFCDDKAPGFINGVLGSVAKKLAAEKDANG